MLFKWVDYCEKYEDEIETWRHDELVDRYVTDDGTKADHLMYLTDERFKEYEYNKGYFCKVVLEEEIIIAVLMIFRSERIPTTIEHFIVNPKYRNKGYGTKIINELIHNTRTIIGFDSDFFETGAWLDNDNKPFMRVWEKNGFILYPTRPNGHNFGFYRYTRSKTE